jgi:hypothetical protein
MRTIQKYMLNLTAGLLFIFVLGMQGSMAVAQTADIQGGLCSGANLQFTENPSGADCSGSGDATAKINDLIRQIVNILSVIVGIAAVIMIIVGGFRYITSGGNDASVTSAKNTILYAIIGLIVVALSQLIVRFVLGKLSQ